MFGGDWCEPPSEVFIRMAVTTLWCWTLDARYDAVGLCGTCYNQTEQEWQEIKGRNKHCLFELVHPTDKVCVVETKDGIDSDGYNRFLPYVFLNHFNTWECFGETHFDLTIWRDILGLYKKFPIRDLGQEITWQEVAETKPSVSRAVSLLSFLVACVFLFTLQGTNISPKNGILKMIFLFPRWDMLVPWRVNVFFVFVCVFSCLMVCWIVCLV